MPHKAKSPPASTGGAQNRSHARGLTGFENSNSRLNLKKIPSRAALARRWPGLHINRLTGRWRDDATGAKGDNIESLLAFLGEGSR